MHGASPGVGMHKAGREVEYAKVTKVMIQLDVFLGEITTSILDIQYGTGKAGRL